MGVSFAKGTRVYFTATFEDKDGNPITPAAPKVRVSYPAGATRGSAVISLTESGGSFVGSWDSIISRQGTVYWSIYDDGADITEEGEFVITSNPANPG